MAEIISYIKEYDSEYLIETYPTVWNAVDFLIDMFRTAIANDIPVVLTSDGDNVSMEWLESGNRVRISE